MAVTTMLGESAKFDRNHLILVLMYHDVPGLA